MTTTTFAVDQNEDWILDDTGNLQMLSDLDAVLTVCQSVSKVRLGELALNTDQGMPFFESVFNGTPNFVQFEAAFRANISRVSGVSEIVSFSGEINSGVFSYVAVIRTIYGIGQIAGDVNG